MAMNMNRTIPLNAPVALQAGMACMPSVYARIAHLEAYYPGFDSWFWDKVVPGTIDGTRLVHTVVRGVEIVAVLIAKRDEAEKKICTLWLDEQVKGSGLGVRLIHMACSWLGTDRPLASVPEERLPEFADILRRIGFVQTEIVVSAYRANKTEYVFNGRLTAFNA